MPVFELLCLHFLWKDKSVCVSVCVCTWIVKNKNNYKSLGHAAELEKIILKGVMRVLKGLACLRVVVIKWEVEAKKVSVHTDTRKH